MTTLVLVRHGESKWNLENRFTGWTDIDLTDKGREEAQQAGEKLRDVRFEKAYTSVLQRAIHTLEIILKEIGQSNIPITQDQALNERNYGDLQGLNKAETAKQYGDEQVKLWRRSYSTRPPNGESLEDTAARVLSYYEQYILPDIKAGRNILIVAHGNSLRSLVMRLDSLTEEEVVELNIPTGVPLRYEFDAQGLPLQHQYL